MIAYGDRARGVMLMQPKDKTAAFQIKLDDAALKSSTARQRGRYLLMSHVSADGKEKSIEARDVTTGATLWRRQFDKWMPRVYMRESQGKFVLMFVGEAAKTESKRDSNLQQVLPQWKKNQERVQLVEIVDANTGQTESSLPITAAHIPDVLVAGDRLLVNSGNRIVAYSITAKQQVGAIFGSDMEAHQGRSLFAALNDRWHISVYDLVSLTKKDGFAFANRIAGFRFTHDGGKLLVLTNDQTLYVLDLADTGKVINAAAPSN
jgi:hypothetical protein